MAEGCGFEIRQAPQGVRGFKSLHLRQYKKRHVSTCRFLSPIFQKLHNFVQLTIDSRLCVGGVNPHIWT